MPRQPAIEQPATPPRECRLPDAHRCRAHIQRTEWKLGQGQVPVGGGRCIRRALYPSIPYGDKKWCQQHDPGRALPLALAVFNAARRHLEIVLGRKHDGRVKLDLRLRHRADTDEDQTVPTEFAP